MNTDFRVVSLRPAGFGTTGDSGRAASIVAALRGGGFSVVAESALRDGEGFICALVDWRTLKALAKGVLRHWRSQPIQCLLVQAILQARGADVSADTTVFVTSRVAPARLPTDFCVDFVDSLALNARSRAATAPRLWRPFWKREARLLAEWERSLAAKARVGTAVSDAEAGLIGSGVLAVALERSVEVAPKSPSPARDEVAPSVVFAGNLHYYPNHEAAMWVMESLTPTLVRRGWQSWDIIIAGRRPSRVLRARARYAGVTLVADAPDLAVVIRRATISLAPVVHGSGVQTKVVNSLASGMPMVITGEANRGLGLGDSWMVRVVERSASLFADAIEFLIDTHEECSYPRDVEALIEASSPRAVRDRWLDLLVGGRQGS